MSCWDSSIVVVGRLGATTARGTGSLTDENAKPAAGEPTGRDLQAIIDAWPTLPEATKPDIQAMVDATGPHCESTDPA
jgi:hypothetical protein